MKRLALLLSGLAVVCGFAGCGPRFVIVEKRTEKTERVIEQRVVDPGDKN